MLLVMSALFRKGRDDYGRARSDLEMELALGFLGWVGFERLRRTLGIIGGNHEIIKPKMDRAPHGHVIWTVLEYLP